MPDLCSKAVMGIGVNKLFLHVFYSKVPHYTILRRILESILHYVDFYFIIVTYGCKILLYSMLLCPTKNKL